MFSCSTSDYRNDAAIRFNWQEHGFGTIPLQKEAKYGFAFTNPGKTPLVISAVKASCGCTVVEWNNAPVKSEKFGIIHVGYDAASPGMFHKEIKVYYNRPGSLAILKIRVSLEYLGYLQTEK